MPKNRGHKNVLRLRSDQSPLGAGLSFCLESSHIFVSALVFTCEFFLLYLTCDEHYFAKIFESQMTIRQALFRQQGALKCHYND